MPKATKEYNLSILKPSLVKEWHPTKNVQLKPYDVTPGSGKRIWWICQKGHEWQKPRQWLPLLLQIEISK
jgi:hypothetical protein